MTETLSEKRSDLLHLDPRVINVIEGFNVREDYGNIEELANSIKENGVRVNLRGYKKDGQYFLTDGHRRLKACMLLVNEGVEMRVPFISEKMPNEEKRLLDMFICNDGKRLTPLEESSLVNRLKSCGLTVKEISSKMGVTETHVYNMLILNDIPTALKKRIRANEISATLVMDVVKSNKSLDEKVLVEKVESVLNKAKTTGTKVTKKNMDAELGKVNSLAELKKALKLIPESNDPLYQLCHAIVNNRMTCDDFLVRFGVTEPAEAV